MVGLCENCVVEASQGFVCSDQCRDRADVLDRVMGIQAANLTARSHMAWFIVPALLIVIGALFLGESLLFGTPSSSIKIIVGTFLAVMGVAWVFYVVFVKKHGST